MDMVQTQIKQMLEQEDHEKSWQLILEQENNDRKKKKHKKC